MPPVASSRLLRRTLAAILLLALVVPVGVGVARATFQTSERSIAIGAHDAILRPDYTGDIVLDFGPLFPRVKLPPEDRPLGIGARIQLGDADVASLDELLARDAVIASQPEGEIAAVREAITDMWIQSAVRGAGVSTVLAVVLVGGWVALGADRRRQIAAAWSPPDRRRAVVGGTVLAVVVAGVVVAVRSDPSQVVDDTEWVRIVDVFPDLPSDPLVDRLEVSDGAALRSGESLIEGAIRTYQESNAFFSRLAETAEDVELRTPEDGQTTALVVTDRHNNIAVDPVARQLAENAEAELLINLGDDTSSGATWEEFSINSLVREFEGFDIVAVVGNHDSGHIADHLKDHGAVVLEGEPVEVAGIRFLGDADPRSSGLTKGYTGDEKDNIAAIKTVDADLTEIACDDDEEIAVVLVHSAAMARELARSGCVPLILSGHLHRQVGPDVVTPEEDEAEDAEAATPGTPTVTLTIGSTGGAIYAFALGTGLRREAQVAVVTFEDGLPVGLQLVDIQPGGTITPQPYATLEEIIAATAPVDPDAPTPPEPEPTPETVE